MPCDIWVFSGIWCRGRALAAYNRFVDIGSDEVRGGSMASQEKKLSVVIPLYNLAKQLPGCMESVLAASDGQMEIVLVDDGSTDGTLAVAEGYKRQAPDRVVVVTQKNSGPGAARNLGIEKSHGTYISFIDGDDQVDKDFFHTLLAAIEKDHADIIVSGYRRVVDGKIDFTLVPQDIPWSRYLVMAPWAKVYSRDFIMRNGLRFSDSPIGEDVYFNTVAYSYADKIGILPYAGYSYICNSESLTNTKSRGLREDIEFTSLLDHIDADVKVRDELLNYQYIKYGIHYLLYSGRSATKERFLQEHGKLMDWYRAHQVPLKFPMGGVVSSEFFQNRLILNIYLLLTKAHLVGAFASIYCKG